MARKKDQAERRTQLIAAATQAVRDHGPSAARLADIAHEAGVSPAAVLYYYPDVRELYTAVLARGSLEYCLHREERVASATDPASKLWECIRSGIPRPGPSQEVSRLLVELAPVVLRNEEAAVQREEWITRQTALYRDILIEGADAGTFRLVADPTVLGRSFVALEDGYVSDVLTGRLTVEDCERRLALHAWMATGAEVAPASLSLDQIA